VTKGLSAIASKTAAASNTNPVDMRVSVELSIGLSFGVFEDILPKLG
jgi:hypothetical protein